MTFGEVMELNGITILALTLVLAIELAWIMRGGG
jgi:hypothetical protein